MEGLLKVIHNILVRTITVIIFLSLLLLSYIVLGNTGLISALVFVAVGVNFEFHRVFISTQLKQKRIYLLSFILSSLFMIAIIMSPLEMSLVLLSLGFSLFVPVFFIILYGENLEKHLTVLSGLTFSFLYIVIGAGSCIKIIQSSHGVQLFCILGIVVSFTDTFAFFGGNFFKGRKLAPALSPNKRVSGFVSGLVGGTLFGSLAFYYFFPSFSIYFSVGFSLFGSFLAQIGDLMESLFKRVGAVKDSGRLFLGHGGFFDRVDSFFFSGPFFFFLSWFIENIDKFQLF